MNVGVDSVSGTVDWHDLVPRVIGPSGIHAFFQPIVRLSDFCVEGFEALARPALHLRVPSVEGMFVAADQMGVGPDLDWSCRRAALRQVAALPDRSLLFLNVHTTALLNPVHDVDQMLLLMRFSSWDPQRVVIEITERQQLLHRKRLASVLQQYWEAGFRFALDDVGEGYSTLDAAVLLSPDYLKVAGSVSRAVADDPAARREVRRILRLGDIVGARVIAEGIETRPQARCLEEMGVRLGQGYWLGRPSLALTATTRAAVRHARTVLTRAAEPEGPVEFERMGRWVV
jgi:EAL domain-containing protein (putative c-di-GMP-specific phosphodiesterase class I)